MPSYVFPPDDDEEKEPEEINTEELSSITENFGDLEGKEDPRVNRFRWSLDEEEEALARRFEERDMQQAINAAAQAQFLENELQDMPEMSFEEYQQMMAGFLPEDNPLYHVQDLSQYNPERNTYEYVPTQTIRGSDTDLGQFILNAVAIGILAAVVIGFVLWELSHL